MVFNFQVMKKMYIPECNQDYSTNILRNATFQMDIGRCTETTYMTVSKNASIINFRTAPVY